MAIKTSIGTPTANSYVSVASADSYLSSKDGACSWNNLSSQYTNTTTLREKKESLLIQATREIDFNYRYFSSKYNQGIKGDPVNYQNLEFPRTENMDYNSNLYIPDEIKYATYEQALWIMDRVGVTTGPDDIVTEGQTIGKTTKKYIDPWICRQVIRTGTMPWNKYRF